MPNHNHIYSFKYNVHYDKLCRLESKQIFGRQENYKMLFSNIKVEPSISPFIKSRFDIILYSNDYSELLENIKKEKIQTEGFKAEYLILEGDKAGYRDRLERLRDVGQRIEATPDYYTPSIVYSVCKYENIWYFGILVKNTTEWHKHKEKPQSFSSALNLNIAKSLVNIASNGDTSKKLLDACCGVGTVMLEACYSGYDIEGCDVNWKASKNTKENLAHFQYTAKVHHSDIKDLDKKYDAAIIDLPYNINSHSTDEISVSIIAAVARLTSRIVVVSISNIEALIEEAGLKVADYCTIEKRGHTKFTRYIWVCGK